MPEKEPCSPYENFCKKRFDELKKWFEKLEARLFEDNGDECLQSKVNRHDHSLALLSKVVWCVVGIAGTIVAALLVALIKSL
jgi:prephenate dehydrogenase